MLHTISSLKTEKKDSGKKGNQQKKATVANRTCGLCVAYWAGKPLGQRAKRKEESAKMNEEKET